MKKWTEITGGLLNRAWDTLMTAFGNRADEAVEMINTQGVADRIAALILNNGYELTTSQARAREIMGTNFFGIEEAVKHFGVSLSRRQIAYMSEIPFSEATLEACKDTHLLVAVTPISVVEIRTKMAEVKLPKGQKSFLCHQDWYDGQAFANEKGQLEWWLVHKTPVPDSLTKTWEQQQRLLDENIEETPKAQTMVYAIIGHFLTTGELLFEEVWVRCSDLGSGGCRVDVGRFDAGGLRVNNNWDGYAYGYLGLASSRKFES